MLESMYQGPLKHNANCSSSSAKKVHFIRNMARPFRWWPSEFSTMIVKFQHSSTQKHLLPACLSGELKTPLRINWPKRVEKSPRMNSSWIMTTKADAGLSCSGTMLPFMR